MNPTVIAECVEELDHLIDPTPGVTAATRSMRIHRSEQLDEIRGVDDRAEFFRYGYRSATDWLADTTGEGYGHCKLTLQLADRIRHMPIIAAAFAVGDLVESKLRLLTQAWSDTVADAFARDEQLLCGWATTLPFKDFRFVLDTWRLRADPERESKTAQEQFDSRALHLSKLMDGVGVIDGVLDPEGFALVREAIRALSQPADGETRTTAQRRADAPVEMARTALRTLEPTPGKKRRKPKVVATIAYDDLVNGPGDGDDGSSGGSGGGGGGGGGVIDTDIDTTVVDYGRAHRMVSDSLFDTLLIRDHGCRWSGCAIPAGSFDAHHATHWLNGGETKPDNLVLLCWFHHHLLHEQHWSIEPLGGGHFTLNSPRGDTQLLRPPLVGLALPARPPAPSAASPPP